ncbi:MAG: HupE/UreJ family protein [Patescibacteria group bacterium]
MKIFFVPPIALAHPVEGSGVFASLGHFVEGPDHLLALAVGVIIALQIVRIYIRRRQK